MRCFIAIIILAFSLTLTNSQQLHRRPRQQNCITPRNYYGTCVRLTYCPSIVNFFQTANVQIAQQYAFASQRSCGAQYIEGDPVVCCTRPVRNTPRPATAEPSPAPNPFFPQQQTTRSPFVEPTTSRETRNPQNPFITPNHITKRRTTTTTTTTPRPTTTTTTPRPATSAALIDSGAKSCRDPRIREGICIALQNCEDLINELYEKQGDNDFANYLRASNQICGGTGSIICCPSKQQPTEAPVIIVNTNEVPTRLPTAQEGCGYTANSYKKIVGGEVSKKGAWPWIALIGYDDDLSASPFKCGGTLITARHVLTAAHCIRNDLSFVRLGEHDLSTDTETRHVDIKVVRREGHPQYNRRNGRNDIAMLYLERNVEFSSLISPICLPITPELRSKSYVRHTPFVVGWGKTMEGGSSANVLQELQIPIYENAVCEDRYQKQNRFFSSDQFDAAVICAGVLSGGKDTCQGDSGGPLMIPESYENNVRYYLIGVVSYGIGCARPEVPGVYTSTQYFLDWITEKIKDTP